MESGYYFRISETRRFSQSSPCWPQGHAVALAPGGKRCRDRIQQPMSSSRGCQSPWSRFSTGDQQDIGRWASVDRLISATWHGNYGAWLRHWVAPWGRRSCPGGCNRSIPVPAPPLPTPSLRPTCVMLIEPTTLHNTFAWLSPQPCDASIVSAAL